MNCSRRVRPEQSTGVTIEREEAAEGERGAVGWGGRAFVARVGGGGGVVGLAGGENRPQPKDCNTLILIWPIGR